MIGLNILLIGPFLCKTLRIIENHEEMNVLKVSQEYTHKWNVSRMRKMILI